MEHMEQVGIREVRQHALIRTGLRRAVLVPDPRVEAWLAAIDLVPVDDALLELTYDRRLARAALSVGLRVGSPGVGSLTGGPA